MKKLMIVAALAAQFLAAAQPAAAAEPVAQESARVGAFGGLRLRVRLGGDTKDRQVRAGLTLAPTTRGRTADGVERTRFGEGLEFSVEQDRGPELSFARTRLDRIGIAPNGTAPDGRRHGVSTLGWVAIGVGAAVVIVLGTGYLIYENADDRDCGNC